MRSRTCVWSLVVCACGATAAPIDHAEAPDAPREARVEERIEVDGDFLPLMPVAVTSFGGASDGEHFYALGGYHGTPHDYHRDGQSRSFARLRHDGTGGWEDLGTIDRGLQGLALVAHEGSVCRLGGSSIANAEGEPVDMRSVPDAACWRDGEWSALPPLPSGRSSHGAVSEGGVIYVAGGWEQRGGPDRASFAETMLVLDGGDWRSVPQPFARRALGVAAAGGKIIAIGGLTAERQPSAQVDVFDPTTREWSRGPDFPGDAFGISAVGIGDEVVASARDGVVRRWRVGDAAWRDAGTLAFPRFFHQILARGDDAVVAIGGISGMHTGDRTRQVEVVRLDGARAAVSTWTLSNPGAARNRQAAFVLDDALYLFGGNTSQEQHDFEPERFVDEGWRLDLNSMRWTSAPPYPARRQSMVVIGERAFVIGGFGHDGTNAVTFPEVFTFDGETWRPGGALPASRTQVGTAVHGGALFVFGGLNYDPSRGERAFDHQTHILRAPIGDALEFEDIGVELGGQRRAFAGAVLGDRYVMVGGMRDEFELVDECAAMSLTSRTFEAFPCPRASRLSAELIALDGRLYLVGGSVRQDGAMRGDRSIEVYDPETNGWSLLAATVPFETRHLRAFAFHGRLLLVGATDEGARMRIALVDVR